MSEDGEIDVESDGLPDGYEVRKGCGIRGCVPALYMRMVGTVALWHAGRPAGQARSPQCARAEKEGSYKGLLP